MNSFLLSVYPVLSFINTVVLFSFFLVLYCTYLLTKSKAKILPCHTTFVKQVLLANFSPRSLPLSLSLIDHFSVNLKALQTRYLN